MKQYFWPSFMVMMSAMLIVAGFSPLPLAYAAPILGAAFFAGVRWANGAWPKPDWALYVWCIALCALGAASSLWSVTPEDSLERSLKIAAILLFSLPLIDIARTIPEDRLRKWRLAIPFAALIAGLFPLLELHFDLPVTRLATGMTEGFINKSLLNKNVSVFVLILPIALLLCHKAGAHTLALALVIIAISLGLFTNSQASQLALFAIPLAWVGAVILPGAGIPLAFGAVAFLMLMMPWLSPLAFDMFADKLAGSGSDMLTEASISMRLENWDFISRKVMENPWTGFGMDATRSIQDFQTQELYFKGSTIMHPHNIGLQFWIEFGVLGLALALGFLAFLLRRLLKLPTGARRIPFTLFCVTMVFLMISWSVWSGWLIAYLVYLAALMILATRTSSGHATS